MFGTNEKTEKTTNSRGDQLNGLLDKGCSFEGKLTFDGTVQINGDFAGEIYSDGTLVIGNDASVNAKIYVDKLITYGKVEGEIEAKSKIEMHLPAKVVARVKTKSLSIEDGVIFEGQCQMDQIAVERTVEKNEKNYSKYDDSSESIESEEDALLM